MIGIVGMEKPKVCGECRFCSRGFDRVDCILTGRDLEGILVSVDGECPIVELPDIDNEQDRS